MWSLVWRELLGNWVPRFIHSLDIVPRHWGVRLQVLHHDYKTVLFQQAGDLAEIGRIVVPHGPRKPTDFLSSLLPDQSCHWLRCSLRYGNHGSHPQSLQTSFYGHLPLGQRCTALNCAKRQYETKAQNHFHGYALLMLRRHNRVQVGLVSVEGVEAHMEGMPERSSKNLDALHVLIGPKP